MDFKQQLPQDFKQLKHEPSFTSWDQQPANQVGGSWDQDSDNGSGSGDQNSGSGHGSTTAQVNIEMNVQRQQDDETRQPQYYPTSQQQPSYPPFGSSVPPKSGAPPNPGPAGFSFHPNPNPNPVAADAFFHPTPGAPGVGSPFHPNPGAPGSHFKPNPEPAAPYNPHAGAAGSTFHPHSGPGGSSFNPNSGGANFSSHPTPAEEISSFHPSPGASGSSFHPNPGGAGSHFSQNRAGAQGVSSTGQNQFTTPVQQHLTGFGTPLSQLMRPELGPSVPWTTEIFGCLNDCSGFPLVVLAPCIAFGQIAEVIDTGYNSCHTASIIYALAFSLGIPCLYSFTYRTKMRYMFNLREDPLPDLCTHLFCEFCAIAQEYRELRYRGIDPNLGFMAQEQVVLQAMAAPIAPQMRK